MKKILFIISLAVLTIGLLDSCKKEDPVVGVTGVTLDKTEMAITVGDPDVKLIAIVVPENAIDKTVSWSSDNTDVATVDQEGNVHAVAEGKANITVTTKDGGKTATCTVTVKAAETVIETVADVLATVVGGFPEDTSGGTTPVAPSNAWTNGSGSNAFVYGPALVLQNGSYMYAVLTTKVTEGENCYTAQVSTLGVLTFNMKDGILTSFEYKNNNEEKTQYDGIYNPVQATLTMNRPGEGEEYWNKIAILIKGTDIVSGTYYFNEATVVNAASNLEELVKNEGIALTAEQIMSINSAEGLCIIEEGQKEETEYKAVFVVKNSAGYSKTIVAAFNIGQAPPPM